MTNPWSSQLQLINTLLAEKDRLIKEKDELVASKDKLWREMHQILQERDEEIQKSDAVRVTRIPSDAQARHGPILIILWEKAREEDRLSVRLKMSTAPMSWSL